MFAMNKLLIALVVALVACAVVAAITFRPKSQPPLQVDPGSVPQQGVRLGEPGAPLKAKIYVDLQCPACRAFFLESLPGVISGPVKTGRAALYLQPVNFLGADSQRAAQAAYAAGDQNKMWQMADLLMSKKGARNGSYTTDQFFSSLASQLGISPRLLIKAIPSKASDVSRSTSEAEKLGIRSTPGFVIEGGGAPPEVLEYDGPRSLENALAGR